MRWSSTRRGGLSKFYTYGLRRISAKLAVALVFMCTAQPNCCSEKGFGWSKKVSCLNNACATPAARTMARRGAVLSLQLPLLWLCFSFATGSLNMKPGSLNINSNFASVREQASKIQSDIIDWRRYLHMKPEMMYQEYETSEYIQKVLKSMGISFTLGWANNTRYGRISVMLARGMADLFC